MPKIYTKNTWVDEELDGNPLYDIKQADDTPIHEDVKIGLVSDVVTAGTAVNASRMNNLENGVDGLDNLIALYLTDKEVTVLNSDITLANSDSVQQYLDPGGESRFVTLPSTVGHPFLIVNASDETSGTESLSIKDAEGNAIDTVEPGQVKLFIGNATSDGWIVYGSAGALAELSDVDVTGVQDGDALIYDSYTEMWIPGESAGALADLSDVDVSTAEDGNALVYDEDSSKWIPGTSGGASLQTEFTNRSGSDISAGDIVIIEPDYDKSIKVTDVQSDLRVVGVANEDIANEACGDINTLSGTIVTINCTSGAVNRGEYLVTSTTAGKAQSDGYFRRPAAFAVALTEKSAGSAGTVDAMLIQDIKQTLGGGFGWAMGGYNNSTESTNTQKLTISAGTWATVAGAALPAARQAQGGLGATTVGAYSIGGYAGSAKAEAYKVTYATETCGAVATANLAAGRYQLSNGANATDKGWIAGGSAPAKTTDKITYATDTRSAGADLSSARTNQRGVSDGATIYLAGGTAVTCDKIVVSTEAISANPDGNLGTYYNGYITNSFPATAGYWAVKNGANDYARKLPFATGVSANSNKLDSNQYFSHGISNGVSLGFASGDYTSPCVKSSLFVLATETWANDVASTLEVGKHYGAWASYGTY